MRSADERVVRSHACHVRRARITDTMTSCCLSVSSWEQGKNSRRSSQVLPAEGPAVRQRLIYRVN